MHEGSWLNLRTPQGCMMSGNNSAHASLCNGSGLDFEAALTLAEETPLELLLAAADALRAENFGSGFDLCSIINAKSGRCTENCRFCAQSAHHCTDIEEYPLVALNVALDQAQENAAAGVARFSLVTAGRGPTTVELAEYGKIFCRVRTETPLFLCASMGLLTEEKAAQLVSYGVSRYHCNLEACRAYFPKVCTTHTWEEKVRTLRIAKKAGMSLCSGGIIGIGETLADRVALACELRDLEVFSIPINIFTPIPGTPFAHLKPLTKEDILRAVAIFRLLNPRAVIRMAGGRNLLGAEQYQCFRAGANGAIVGNYLTTSGNTLQGDLENIRNCGFSFTPITDE